MSVTVGQRAPDIRLTSSAGGELSLADLAGKVVVLYFYPKDDTPGCTKEACAFRDLHGDLVAAGATVLGVSSDNLKSHARFVTKYNLNFILLSDPDRALQDAFGVWVEKKQYGRTYMGTERSTFLIDREGVVRQAWRKVKVDGHAEAVLAAVKALA